jgi:hypothetical protein
MPSPSIVWISTDTIVERTLVSVVVHRETLETVRRTFPYLFPTHQPGALVRHVAKLDFRVIEPWQQLNICGVPMVPIPVKHGEDMVNLGFVIGENKKICYISDVRYASSACNSHTCSSSSLLPRAWSV